MKNENEAETEALFMETANAIEEITEADATMVRGAWESATPQTRAQFGFLFRGGPLSYRIYLLGSFVGCSALGALHAAQSDAQRQQGHDVAAAGAARPRKAMPTPAEVQKVFDRAEAEQIADLITIFHGSVVFAMGREPHPEDDGVRKVNVPDDIPGTALGETVTEAKAAGWTVRVVDVPEGRHGGQFTIAAHKILHIVPSELPTE